MTTELLYIGLFEECYNIVHKDNYEDYLKICKKAKYQPNIKIVEFYENN